MGSLREGRFDRSGRGSEGWGGVETTVKRTEEEGNINRRPVSVLDSPGLQG